MLKQGICLIPYPAGELAGKVTGEPWWGAGGRRWVCEGLGLQLTKSFFPKQLGHRRYVPFKSYLTAASLSSFHDVFLLSNERRRVPSMPVSILFPYLDLRKD